MTCSNRPDFPSKCTLLRTTMIVDTAPERESKREGAFVVWRIGSSRHNSQLRNFRCVNEGSCAILKTRIRTIRWNPPRTMRFNFGNKITRSFCDAHFVTGFPLKSSINEICTRVLPVSPLPCSAWANSARFAA